MEELIIQTQKEFNDIDNNFSGKIIIRDTKEFILINKSFIGAYMYVSGNATIGSVSGNATIGSVYGNATIGSVYGNATIKYVSDNVTIGSVSGNATILLMTGLSSIVLLYSAKKIVARGMNLIRQIGVKKVDIEKTKTVTFVQIKETISKNPTFKVFEKFYPVEKNGKKVKLYKAVHKKNEEYVSEYNNNFKYIIGEEKTEQCDKRTEQSCSNGIHLSILNWAVLFGKKWVDMAILECETDIKDIVVSEDCDGKVRTSKCKVIREVPKSEY